VARDECEGRGRGASFTSPTGCAPWAAHQPRRRAWNIEWFRLSAVPASLRHLLFLRILSLSCYALALGCRENAALFPVVCWMGDRLIGTGRRRLISLGACGLRNGIGRIYALRIPGIGGFPVPPPLISLPVSASLEFVNYVAYKVVMMRWLFFFMPIVPVAAKAFSTSGRTLSTCCLPSCIADWIDLVGYRFRRSVLWPLVWLACLIAPMMLVFASRAHLYLPSLGMVLLLTPALAALADRQRPRRLAGTIAGGSRRLSGRRRNAGGGGMNLGAWGHLRRGMLSEDLLVRDVLRRLMPLRDGEHLFSSPCPWLAVLRGFRDPAGVGIKSLHGHVLVVPPDLISYGVASSVDRATAESTVVSVIAPAREDKRILSGTKHGSPASE